MKRISENDGDQVSNLTEESLSAKAEGKQSLPAVPARRAFLRTSLLGSAALATAAAKPLAARGAGAGGASNPAVYAGDVPAFELDEVTISDLQDAMKSGKMTSRSITEKYLARIDQIDKQGPALNAIIELNPDALSIADAMDAERKSKGPRGTLHGIPVLIKDNIDTADKMMTTAGSLALLGSKAPKDSTVAQKLRDSGAVILGKTNLSEWANIRSNHSTSGWSGRGGQTKNPYALDRNPCGSSSGSGAAVSANLAAAAIGTETDGSIVCPSSTCGIAGIKPTVGLVSRAGIIPISHTQDTAGPMCRTLRDAAILLGALTGMDSADSATAESREHSYTDYTQFLKEDGLKGARIGVVRRTFGFSEDVDKVMEAALETMKKQGAILVDPATIESAGKFGESEFTIFLYELKADLNAYLAKLGPNAPVKTLKEIIEFNEKNSSKEMPYFGQDTFLKSDEKGPLTTQEYIDAVAKARDLARKEGIDATMDKNNLDALVGPTGGPAWLTDHINGDSFGGGSSSTAAVAGYPNITVPAGFVHGLPVGISFFGRAWSEPVLLRVAYAFEQATKARKAPGFAPTLNI
jgi:amidase